MAHRLRRVALSFATPSKTRSVTTRDPVWEVEDFPGTVHPAAMPLPSTPLNARTASIETDEVDFDPATYRQIAELLGTERGSVLLSLLREALIGLHDASDDGARLASAHRLKSEAGMMGFRRLSRDCDAVGVAGMCGPISPEVWGRAFASAAAALPIIDRLIAQTSASVP